MSNIIEVEDVLSGSSDEDSSSSSDDEVMFVDEESTVQAPPNIAESQSRSKSPVWGRRGATPDPPGPRGRRRRLLPWVTSGTIPGDGGLSSKAPGSGMLRYPSTPS